MLYFHRSRHPKIVVDWRRGIEKHSSRKGFFNVNILTEWSTYDLAYCILYVPELIYSVDVELVLQDIHRQNGKTFGSILSCLALELTVKLKLSRNCRQWLASYDATIGLDQEPVALKVSIQNYWGYKSQTKGSVNAWIVREAVKS